MSINIKSYRWVKFHSISDFNDKDYWKTKSAAKSWIEKNEIERRKIMQTPYPCGIYVYGFIEKINGKYLFAPYYVGKSRNIFDRLYNHIAGLRGCSLAIYKRHEIFSTDKDFKKNQPLNFGSLSFFKSFIDNEYNNLGRAIYEEVNWMMRHFVVTWIIEPDAKKREQLEKQVGKILNTKYLITKIDTLKDDETIPDAQKIETLETDNISSKLSNNEFAVNSLLETPFENENKTMQSIIKNSVGKPFYEIDKVNIDDFKPQAQNILANPYFDIE